MTKAPALLCSLMLLGCGYQTFESPVNYHYSGQPGSHKPSHAQYGIAVTRVIDDRAVSDPRIILHLVHNWGGYAAEEPIAEIVRKGIIAALEQAGYAQGDDLSMEVVIGESDYSQWEGFFSVKKATLELRVTVTLRRSGAEIARNTVIGQSTALKDEIARQSEQELMATLFTRSLDDTIFQIVEIVNLSVIQ